MSVEVIDTRFLEIEHAIACHRADDVIVDPGPASSVHNVIEALGDRVPTAILLTHVHLDHAGGTGKLVEHYPETQVFIHEVGAPHIIDPTRLLASAGRVYGDSIERFGETIPVPEANVHTIADGDVVGGFEAIHTPGHSGHHMAFFHLETEYAIVGDLVGQTIHGFEALVMSTPPPEINIELWIDSIDKLAERMPSPSTLGLTHFGRVPNVIDQMEAAKRELRRVAELAKQVDEEAFVRDTEQKLEQVPADIAESLVMSLAPLEQNHMGLVRYWNKRDAGELAVS